MWAEAEEKEKAYIARFDDQAIKKAEAEERVRVKVRVRDNYAKSTLEEATTEIRSEAEAKGAEIYMAEAEARSWAESEIREDLYSTRAESGANGKADTEAVERARLWAKAEANEKADIARFDA